MKIPPICVPIVGETHEIFLSNLREVMTLSHFIELRFDSLQDITIATQVKQLTSILHQIPRDMRFIFTCRPTSEGGKYILGEPERVALIEAFCSLYCANGYTNGYIDIELSTLAKYSFDMGNVPRIVSYHNFSKTPQIQAIYELIDKMKAHKPCIVKIATMVNSDEDIQCLYNLIITRHDPSLLVIGMGAKGRSTRIITPLLGAPWTYAASSYGGSAPGQLNIEEMQELYAHMLQK